MHILGWHGGIKREWQDMAPGWSTHDGAAVLLRGGEIVAAVEEERLNRVKHSNFFPALAIRKCLELGGISFRDVDVVAVNFSERTRDIFPADAGLPSVDLFLEDRSSTSSSVRDFLDALFMNEFDAKVSDRLHFCNHHLAHLWSAWGPAGFAEGLVVSLDGSGDALSGVVARGTRHGLEALREYTVDQSIGNLYSDSVRFLGYRRFDEYKVMGLAPYGDAERFRPLFRRFFELLPGGDYRLTDRRERWGLIHDAGLIGVARRSSEDFSQVHRDFAAALQWATETIILHILRHYAEATGLRNLCYAGGVAHNCTLNGRLLYEGMFDNVFVQPAAHDAGGALGAALSAAHECGEEKQAGFPGLFLGADLPDSVGPELEPWSRLVEFERVEDASSTAAALLAEGEVIGWVRGRSEFGPRALGHRSILADPRPAENQRRINGMTKKRESYRPFAPTVLEERLSEVVELPQTNADFSFMTYALRVRADARTGLRAVTHVDGTARVQSVSRDSDPAYWRLVAEFHRLTGVPAVLNTSFNNNAEPIVDTITDAVTCFLTTDIDCLIVGDFLVRRRPGLTLADAVTGLRPSVPASRKLVARTEGGEHGSHRVFTLDSTASRHFATSRIEITRDVHTVLLEADGSATLADLFERCEIGESRAEVVEQLIELWRLRAIALLP